jgi:hypothetical protein
MLLKYNQNDEMKYDERDRECSTHGREEGCIQGFGGKTRRPVERPRRRWVDDIKMNLR